MRAGLGRIAEAVFALELLGGRGARGGLRSWLKQVRAQLGERLAGVEQLIAAYPPIPCLLWLLGSSGACSAPDDSEQRHIRALVSDFCGVALEPYWSQIRCYLEIERELRARIAITKGFDGLLSTLHSGICWKFPILEIPGCLDDEVHLAGRGLLLAPSVFLRGKQCAIINAEKFSSLPTLIFPASQSPEIELAGSPPVNNFALGALIGHSRAAALEVLADGCTTGELSRRLALSLAGASKHATILRQAGLVTTFRHRNTALHVVTPLGLALLRGNEQQQYGQAFVAG